MLRHVVVDAGEARLRYVVVHKPARAAHDRRMMTVMSAIFRGSSVPIPSPKRRAAAVVRVPVRRVSLEWTPACTNNSMPVA